jgi:hypothetical protein
MRLVGGLHWVEDPNTWSFLGSTTTTPTTRQDIIVGVSFVFVCGLSSVYGRAYCLRTLFSLSTPFHHLFHHPFASPSAVVRRLRDIIATTDFFYPPYKRRDNPIGCSTIPLHRVLKNSLAPYERLFRRMSLEKVEEMCSLWLVL